LFRNRAIIELVPEVTALLKFKRSADFHLLRLVEAGNRCRRCSSDEDGGEEHPLAATKIRRRLPGAASDSRRCAEENIIADHDSPPSNAFAQRLFQRK
jgi:hypothetical protein